MTITTNLDYEKFLALTGSEMVAYLEPLVNEPATRVSRDILERMLSDLPMLDECHLVYAIELGVAHSPDVFAPRAAQYLAHESASVCSTASRVLTKLSQQYVTQDLIDTVRQIPLDRKLFTEPINGVRHLIGTNTSLIRELLVELRGRLKEKQRKEAERR